MQQPQPSPANLECVHGLRIFNGRHAVRAFSNDPVVQRSQNILLHTAFQNIVRSGAGVIMPDAYSASRREIQ